MAPDIHAPIIPRGILHATATKLNPININAHEGVSMGHLSAIIARAIDVMKKTEAAVILILKNAGEYLLKRTLPSTRPLKKAEKTTNGSTSAETINVEITESLTCPFRTSDARGEGEKKKCECLGKVDKHGMYVQGQDGPSFCGNGVSERLEHFCRNAARGAVVVQLAGFHDITA